MYIIFTMTCLFCESKASRGEGEFFVEQLSSFRVKSKQKWINTDVSLIEIMILKKFNTFNTNTGVTTGPGLHL
jgi:hypothetical protein